MGSLSPMHPTAAKVAERLALRGLSVQIRELPDSTRTAKEAATACGCDVGQIVKSHGTAGRAPGRRAPV